jgi:hypothetical protein
MAIAQPDTVRGGYRSRTWYSFKFKNGEIDSSTKSMVFSYKYDENGFKTSQYQCSANGSGCEIQKLEFNHLRNEITHKYCDSSEKVIYMIIYRYDEKDRQTEEIEYNNDSIITNRTVFKYNKNDKLIERVSYDSINKEKEKYILYYDISGNRLDSGKHFIDESIERCFKYQYNKQGKETEALSCASDSDEYFLNTKILYGKTGIKTEEILYDEYHNSIYSKTIYNKKGKMIEYMLYDNNQPEFRTFYIYDEFGNVIETATYNSYEILSKDIFEYSK